MVDERGRDELGFDVEVEELGLKLPELVGLEDLFSAFADVGTDLVEIVVEFGGVPADLLQRFVEGETLPLAGGQIEFGALISNDPQTSVAMVENSSSVRSIKS